MWLLSHPLHRLWLASHDYSLIFGKYTCDWQSPEFLEWIASEFLYGAKSREPETNAGRNISIMFLYKIYVIANMSSIDISQKNLRNPNLFMQYLVWKIVTSTSRRSVSVLGTLWKTFRCHSNLHMLKDVRVWHQSKKCNWNKFHRSYHKLYALLVEWIMDATDMRYRRE